MCVHPGRPCEEVAVYKPRREALLETNPADIWILDFYLLELWENKRLLFKPPLLWYFVKANLANQFGEL